MLGIKHGATTKVYSRGEVLNEFMFENNLFILNESSQGATFTK